MYFKQGTGDREPNNMENTNLPEELIVQILLRLPVKSLLRFRLVSKSWLALISNPHFAKSHFELAAAPTDKLLHLAAYASESRSVDLEASLHDDSVSVAVKLNFLVPTSNVIVKIMGSCRGFLLFDDYSNLFLWNPSTGVHKRLPPCTLNVSATVFTFLYGFGYDPSTDDYLVVVASYDTSAADLVTHFEFFSLRANSWRKIEGTNLPYMNAADEPKAGWLLNGAIHWFAFRHDSSVHVIIAFDLIERVFSEIPLPDDFEFERDCQFCDLRVFGGCLRLCYTGYVEIAEIWVMEEYKAQSSWTKSIVVSMDEIPTEYFSPICSTKCGDIVGIDGSTGLVKCNGKGELLEHRTYSDDPHGCEVAVYTESLLSLPGDSGQAAEDDHQ